jgi:hypothetical protein
MANDFSSWWKIEAHFQNGTGAWPVCFFQQTDALLAGTCKGPNAIGGVEGQVNGNQIQFTIHYRASNPQGATGDATFYGTMGPDGNMSGNATSATGAPGQFVGTR